MDNYVSMSSKLWHIIKNRYLKYKKKYLTHYGV